MRYEYACEASDCGEAEKRVEVTKPVAEMERPEPCSRCQRPMRRLISLSSFSLKGGGWHKTDYPKR